MDTIVNPQEKDEPDYQQYDEHQRTRIFHHYNTASARIDEKNINNYDDNVGDDYHPFIGINNINDKNNNFIQKQIRFRRKTKSSLSYSSKTSTPLLPLVSLPLLSPLSLLYNNNNGKYRKSTIQRQQKYSTLSFLFVITTLLLLVAVDRSEQNPHEVFTNSFHVRFRRDVNHHTAHLIANKHGFVNLGPVCTIFVLISTKDNFSWIRIFLN